MRIRGKRSGGFTLIELLVVVAIIGILAGVVVGQYRRSIIKAKEAVLRENLFTVRSQINHYFADKGKYPFDLQSLVDDHYLKSMPRDPITESTNSWILIPAERGEEDISLEPGIADIQSGAPGYGLDGTAFSDW
jgi:general secretion pathway protein G